jgi:hypothetical protein
MRLRAGNQGRAKARRSDSVHSGIHDRNSCCQGSSSPGVVSSVTDVALITAQEISAK